LVVAGVESSQRRGALRVRAAFDHDRWHVRAGSEHQSQARERRLRDVSPSRLLFPLLFAPIVYYPIWLVGSKQADTVFSYYAAFLNGYFWQSVVAAAKKPEAP
jgi:hypothetical protein